MADPTNPVAAAKLGIPFFERPAAIKFKYSYKAGEQMIQAVPKDPGNLFGGFDIYNLARMGYGGLRIAQGGIKGVQLGKRLQKKGGHFSCMKCTYSPSFVFTLFCYILVETHHTCQ